MSKPVLVSIVVLCYNQEGFIRQTIESLLNQRREKFDIEIVIGDDASSDRTRDIIIEYKSRFPGLIYLMPKEPNKGVLKNFRDVMKTCKGKYLALCAGDDYWHDPLKLEKQVDFLELNNDYCLVFTDVNYYIDDKGLLIENYNRKYNTEVPEGYLFDSLIAGKAFIHAVTACFSRSHFEQHVNVDEFVTAGFTYEDLPTWIELSRSGKFKYLPDSTATYRIIKNSLSHSNDIGKKIKFLKAHFLIKQHFIEKYNVDKTLAEQFENYYYSKRFMLAYNSGSSREAAEPYIFLKSRGLATPKMKIRKFLLKLPLLRKSIKFVLSFFKPKELVLSQT